MFHTWQTLCWTSRLTAMLLYAYQIMCVPNNVHLTTMGAHQFSMMAAYTPCRKANLPETRDNDTKIRKVGADRN